MSIKVSERIINEYKTKIPPFGYSGLGKIVYARTYSRDDNGKEEWWNTVERVCNGIAEIAEGRIEHEFLQETIDEMYPRIFEMKVLPPGRGLWAGGTKLIKKGLGASLFNCAFVSTDTSDPVDPFTFLMDAMMLGIGVGFDLKGANKIRVYKPNENQKTKHIIDDSREGWVQSLRLLLSSYFIPGRNSVIFDYSRIREEGLILKTFGGKSSGPKPLIQMHERIKTELSKLVEKSLDHEVWISSTTITDIMNIIGVCIVAGNVRRGAEIALGNVNDKQFINLKNYEDPNNNYRTAWSWASNNSVLIESEDDYNNIDHLIQGIIRNGEPGFFNLLNARNYGRMGDEPNYVDKDIKGVNPCGEIGLHHKGLCNLVEINMDKVSDNVHEFQDLLRTALLYAMITTMAPIHWTETGEVQRKTRRLGIGLTGIAEFLSKYDKSIFILLLDTGYKYLRIMNDYYATIFGIEKSCKLTTIKPSGTVSLLAGVSPGMHFPIYEYYERRMLLSEKSELVNVLKSCGYKVEKSITSNDSVCVVFPIKSSGKPISMMEQFELLQILQTYWADNAVSATITFEEEDKKLMEKKIKDILPKVKGFSMLKRDCTTYAQAPYREITKEEYLEAIKNIKFEMIQSISVNKMYSFDATPTLYCDGDNCTGNTF